MKLSDFDFELPDELIATRPAEPRDSARLLHITRDLRSDHTVRALPDLLREGDLLIFNDTKVIPARLFGMRGSARVEVTLHKEISELRSTASPSGGAQPALPSVASPSCSSTRSDEDSASESALSSRSDGPLGGTVVPHQGQIYKAFAKPARKLQLGDRFDVTENFYAEVTAKGEGGEVTLAFNVSGPAFHEALAKHGETPLPPYIAAKRAADDADKDSYQTMFAKEEGAVAAPTASLHFTDSLMEGLSAKGIKHAFVTLHVGAGTFLPVKVDNIADHNMHSEWCEVSLETAEAINQTKASGGRVIPVGTTSLRTLESMVDEFGWMHPGARDTDIFITPGYQFRCTDALMTNFHTPKSTLFMLVSAFMGEGVMKRAYAHAIREQYRFYSYGDACLLDPRG